MYSHGWYQVAFERDLTTALAPAAVGPRQLVLAQGPEGWRAADAFCPHRGAHLAFGGRVEGETIVCPFHGHRIGIGQASHDGFCTRPYPTLVVGGLVFVRISAAEDNGFAGVMAELDARRYFVPGFALRVRAPADLVIENAFDRPHFQIVHGVGTDPRFEVRDGDHGDLMATGVFSVPPTRWRRDDGSDVPQRVEFRARAFSPGLVMSELDGSPPYGVLTAATPTPEGDCVVRVSLVMPADAGGRLPAAPLCEYLLQQSHAGLEKDRLVWEHLGQSAPCRYTAQDASVLAFRRFCHRFTNGNGA
jgi:nitrite reductase/ring-hydroxylating ferredoxin subunit